MTLLDDLTNRQKLAITGRLPPNEWIAEGMGLFTLGLVGMDPLAMDDDPRKFTLTREGRTVAHALRK